jgi:branched-subunit amino acid transport protein
VDSSYFWLNTLMLALGTILIRGSIIAVSSKIVITDRHKDIFKLIPAAILPAMLAPMVYFHQGQVAWLHGKERLFVLILATAVCYLSRNMLATVVFGLGALYVLTRLPF